MSPAKTLHDWWTILTHEEIKKTKLIPEAEAEKRLTENDREWGIVVANRDNKYEILKAQLEKKNYLIPVREQRIKDLEAQLKNVTEIALERRKQLEAMAKTTSEIVLNNREIEAKLKEEAEAYKEQLDAVTIRNNNLGKKLEDALETLNKITDLIVTRIEPVDHQLENPNLFQMIFTNAERIDLAENIKFLRGVLTGKQEATKK